MLVIQCRDMIASGAMKGFDCIDIDKVPAPTTVVVYRPGSAVPSLNLTLACSSPSYLPLYIRDADFLARLLVVVEPFAFREVNACKLGIRFSARGQPFALYAAVSPHALPISPTRRYTHLP
jgi:hypothetical protein